MVMSLEEGNIDAGVSAAVKSAAPEQTTPAPTNAEATPSVAVETVEVSAQVDPATGVVEASIETDGPVTLPAPLPGQPPVPSEPVVDISTPAPKPADEPDMNNLPEHPMPPHQKKHALTMIKAIKRLKDAGPFLAPVDIVKLNIPLYYNYIRRPMDLSTIERKITADAYETPEQIVEDFNVLVQNCFRFNGKDAVISQMARNIQASFEKHMLHMPPKDGPPQAARRRKFVDDVPQLRRDAIGNGRPKREIHPPKSRDMPYDFRPRRRKMTPELRFCQQVLRELMSKKYDSISYPFVEPVDPVALDCPNYFNVVKNPMDLGTVRHKMQNGEYDNGEQFEKDVRQVFINCYLFNPEGTAVNIMGHRLENVFNEKWAKKPEPTEESSHSEDEEDDDEFNVDINSITDPTIEFLLANIQRLQHDLDKMRRSKYEEMKKEWERKRRASPRGRSGKKRRRKSKSGGIGGTSIYPTHVTYEMKKEISDAMSTLNDKQLKAVIAIIREGVPDLGDDDEIELDMDQMDNPTLLKLYNYVVKGKQRKGSQSEEEKIKSLKRKLQQFDDADASMSSSDDDDEESSEEE